MALSIIIFIILFIATAILASLEMALSSVNRIRIKTKAEQGDQKALKILKIVEQYNESITTVIVLNNIINIILPTLSTVIFLTIFIKNQQVGIFLSTLTMTFLLLIFGEIIPKTYGKNNSETLLYAMIVPIGIIIKIFKPITFAFVLVSDFVNDKLLKKSKNDDIEVEDEILTIIEESSQIGLIEANESELIRNAIEFNDIRVDEIIQPKNKVFMIDVAQPNEEIYKLLQKEKYSRVPVYKNTTDEIIGIITERDFLRHYIKNPHFDLNKILRTVDFIPDTLKISKLLPEMQKRHNHMSVVVDEYGTVQGIITVEDIIEELVGEIWDEHDEVVQEYKLMKNGNYQILGSLMINDFNKLYKNINIDTETEDSTIAGYILEIGEKIPEVNEIIEDEQFIFKILSMDGQQIKEIEVKEK